MIEQSLQVYDLIINLFDPTVLCKQLLQFMHMNNSLTTQACEYHRIQLFSFDLVN